MEGRKRFMTRTNEERWWNCHMFSDPELEIKATSVIDNRINSFCQKCTVKVGKLANMSHHWFRLCLLHIFRDGDLGQSHVISVWVLLGWFVVPVCPVTAKAINFLIDMRTLDLKIS